MMPITQYSMVNFIIALTPLYDRCLLTYLPLWGYRLFEVGTECIF